MQFFNPALVWFALGGAIPIIIHLLHRQKYRRVKWAAMEFLLAALKKTQRRLRLENLILLLLRILIMIILAFAIARPYLRAAPLGLLEDSNTHHFLVIDNTYSMAYKKGPKTYLDLAREQADKLLDSLSPHLSETDKITVILASAYPEVYVVYASKLKSVKEMVAAIRPSHYSSGMYQTFRLLDEQVRKSTNLEKRIYLFTDLQRSGWQSLDETEGKRFGELLKRLSSAPDTKISIYDASPKEAVRDIADNRGLVALWVENDVLDTKSVTTFHADLYNWSAVSYPTVDVKFLVDGSYVGTATTPLPPNSLMPATLRHRFHEPGPHFVEAVIDSDNLDVDDRRYLSLDVKTSLSAFIVDGKPLSPPEYSDADYLRMMLASADFSIGGPVTSEMFTADDLDKHDLLVLCNVQALTQDKVAKVEEYVRRGGGLLVTMGDRVDRAAWNDLVYRDGQGLLPGRLADVGGTPPEIQPRVAHHIKQYSGRHPAFRAFLNGPGPFSLVFYQYFKLEKVEPESVLAVLDDPGNSHLFVEKKFGEGKVVLYTSTINAEWDDNMAGKGAFFSIVLSLAPYLAARSSGMKNLQIADLIQHSMPAEKYSNVFVMETPTEGQTSISIERPSPNSPWFIVWYPSRPSSLPGTAPENKPAVNEGLKYAGRYALIRPRADASGQDELISYFAANLPPRTNAAEEILRCEGNLDKITADELRRRFPDFKFFLAGEGQAVGASETAGSSLIWKYLLYALCGFLGLETFLAWFFGRAKQ
ncbi:MAG TPA: BatA domain-containing protein [Planctomycetota bacterium]|nr:BatA domain-containing protein [Planctomycetota bacterium]